MTRKPFLAIGTGRCGTNSITRIVDACKNTDVRHETAQIPWYRQGDPQMGTVVRRLKEGEKGDILAGEVSQCLLPHVKEFRSIFPRMPVVCLHRDKRETVDSFVEFGYNNSYVLRPGDKQSTFDHARTELGRNVVRCFPVLDAWTIRQSYEFYWELYEAGMADIEEPVFHINVVDLNFDAKLHTLFDFLKIPTQDRVLLEKRRYFTREEVQKKKREQYHKIRGQYVRPD